MRTVIAPASDFRRLALATLLPVALVAREPEPSTSSETSRRSPFQVGQAFPDLALPALQDGRLASIRDYRGQKVAGNSRSFGRCRTTSGRGKTEGATMDVRIKYCEV
jgi:hypothetical protein